MSDKIQQIYNQTKFQDTSPKDLDDLILRKVRATKTESKLVWYQKIEVYIPVAASILLVIIFQLSNEEKTNKVSVDNVKSIAKKDSEKSIVNANRNKLPHVLINPKADITPNITPACNGTLIEPEEKMDLIENNSENSDSKLRSSTLPIQSIYSFDKTKPLPECDKISSQILKK